MLIEVADSPEERGKNLVMALYIAGDKSGEKVEVRGEKGFVQTVMKYIPHFNASSGKTVGLTHPLQLQMAGYDRSAPSSSAPEPEQNVPRSRNSGPKPQ